MKVFLSFTIFAILTGAPQKPRPYWGPEGHTIVVKLAMQFVKSEVKENILSILGTMPLDTAANWMDIMRSNSDYDFMKPWHYVDFARDKQYMPSADENIVNRLIIVYNELLHKKTLCSEQVKTDLLVLFHLMGDLHQPLHTGYDDDLGGNKVAVQYDTLKTNLHKFWDEDIIRLNKITLQNCMDLYETNQGLDSVDSFNPVTWMKESRTLLAGVYDYPGFIINDDYLKKNAKVVKRQLLLAGIRLAGMLNKLFAPDTHEINMKEAASKFKDGIEAKDAINYVGKKVTACGRVYGVKTTDKVTFINVGDKFPDASLTVVIFAKDKVNFPQPIEELFNNKNIAVKGEVVNYKGKMEIIISKKEEILILE